MVKKKSKGKRYRIGSVCVGSTSEMLLICCCEIDLIGKLGVCAQSYVVWKALMFHLRRHFDRWYFQVQMCEEFTILCAKLVSLPDGHYTR